jgi:hypothetical protein
MPEDTQGESKRESESPKSYFDIDPEIRQMFETAEKEGRQPNCISCGEPLEIGQSFYTDVWWKWDPDTRRYQKFQEDYANCDKPYCLKCQYRDWDLTNNKWVQY